MIKKLGSGISRFNCCLNSESFGNTVVVLANLVKLNKYNILGLTRSSPNRRPLTDKHISQRVMLPTWYLCFKSLTLLISSNLKKTMSHD